MVKNVKRQMISIDTDLDSDNKHRSEQKFVIRFKILFVFVSILFFLIFSSSLILLKDIKQVQKERAHGKESCLEDVLVSYFFFK